MKIGACVLILVLLTLRFSEHDAALGKDIQDAYHTWQKLSPSCRWEMDLQMQKTLKGISQKELYESLIRGFEIWDHTQNVDGAPGWKIKDSSINDVVKHIGEDMLCLLHAMEEAWMNHKKEASKKLKTSELRFADSEECSPATDSEVLAEKPVEKNDNVNTGTREEDSSGMNADELPQSLPSISKEEKVEKFRKALFEKQEIDDTENKSERDSLLETSQVAGKLGDVRKESDSPTVSRLKDPVDLSLDEDTHLRNLRLSDCQDDSDVEKQISPLISEDET
ncbi:hypothetical protein HNY73_009351 [Argiope bruennichi]|uniref:Uncharacterized protein n=1 Tax=Argiope bruennichi TaxID=94029 RepID=A0A8T0FEF7_ARGBR|nr:hypothetical protein HNY73_009351 [Argiope bruennichi]